MKLTKEQLKNIIKEELGKIMDEKIELVQLVAYTLSNQMMTSI